MYKETNGNSRPVLSDESLNGNTPQNKVTLPDSRATAIDSPASHLGVGTIIFCFRSGVATITGMKMTSFNSREVLLTIKSVRTSRESQILMTEPGFTLLKELPPPEEFEISPQLLSTEELEEKIAKISRLQDNSGATKTKSRTGRIATIAKARDEEEWKKKMVALITQESANE